MNRHFASAAMLVLSGACVRTVEDHCANQDDPRGYCAATHQLSHCSKCIGDQDGCQAEPPQEACLPDDVTSVAEGEETTAAASTLTTTSVGDDSATTTTTATTTAGGTESGSSSEDTGMPPPVCGDDVREGAEICDGTDLNNQTCQSTQHGSGMLLCGTDCEYDFSECQNQIPVCGDGVVNADGEECDGTDLEDRTCAEFPGYGAGPTSVLGCNDECEFDTSQCCLSNGETCTDGAQCCSTLCLDVCVLGQ